MNYSGPSHPEQGVIPHRLQTRATRHVSPISPSYMTRVLMVPAGVALFYEVIR